MQDINPLSLKLDAAARQRPERQAAIDARLQVLYEQLRNGQISDDLQRKLLSFAESLDAGCYHDANALLQELLGEYWQQYKFWLSGLKWLL